MDNPTVQVHTIKTSIGEFNGQRVTEIRIGLWHGESVARFDDLPPDVREALLEWVKPF